MKKKSKQIFITTRAPDQLAQAIQRFRKLKGLTQTELSKIAHLRQGTISKVEKGVPTTSLQSIYDVCSALELEIIIQPRQQSKTKKIEDVFK